MNPKDLKDILRALELADVREFTLKTADYDLSIKRGAEAPIYMQAAAAPPQFQQAMAQPAPVQPQAQSASVQAAVSTPEVAPAAAPAAPAVTPGTPVKAPIVGTFYTSSSPDAPVYVKVGDTVAAGQVLCIIEAMKLMNEIEAESAGTVREILVKNGEPVEYGQTLFIIE